MRNIALLEWGPATLYYLQPRERIKIRTDWLQGGPTMPPFVSSAGTVQANEVEIRVRYALSAFEDLNGTIRNLRRCFGFPYQEYIGFLNTLTRTFRVRREHEGLIDSLRRWAMLENVDAVVWIDYAKANQPPGSIKMGPFDSRPFSRCHVEVCADIFGVASKEHDDVSETWSDVDEPHDGEDTRPERADRAVHGAMHGGAGPEATVERLASREGTKVSQKLDARGGKPRASVMPGSLPAVAPLVRNANLNRKTLGDGSAVSANPPRVASSEAEQNAMSRSRTLDERSAIRSMLQEEFIPAHESIYSRSIAPGPGYYSVSTSDFDDRNNSGSTSGCSFGNGRTFDSVVGRLNDVPGPGQYEPQKGFVEVRANLGRFGQCVKLVSPLEAVRKLPFISPQAAKLEGHGVHSPGRFHSIPPDSSSATRGHIRPPKYSFSQARRPF